MKKLLLVFIVFITFLLATAPVYAYDKTSGPSNGGTTTISNNILDAHIEDTTGGAGIGTYTISTGSAHTNPGQDVFYAGAIGSPWSTYNTIQVFDTLNTYVTTTAAPTPDVGFTLRNLDAFASIMATTATKVRIQWTPTLEFLSIEQVIEVMGTTIADTRVRVTMNVTNNDQYTHYIGIRYQWDIMIDGFDGSWIRPWDGTAGAWLNVETQWTPPPFQYWETTNDPASPVFSVLGSIVQPPVVPTPTPPDRFMLAAWGSNPSPGLYDFAYSFTPTGRTVAGAFLDSAVAYYWDEYMLMPGETRSVTAYIWCLYIPPTPAPVGGIWVPINQAELLAPWIGLASLMIVATASIVYVKHRKQQD